MEFLTSVDIKELGELARLSPAETYYLLEGKKADYKKLFQVTVSDLHLKQALTIKVREEGSGRKKKKQTLIYVSLGKSHSTYVPRPHETPFITIFNEEPEVEYLLSHYVMAVKQEIGSVGKFVKTYLLQNAVMKRHYRPIAWRALLGLHPSMTQEGENEQALQVTNIRLLNQHLPRLIEKNPAVAKPILNLIGGNVFLLEAVDHKLLKILAKGYANDAVDPAKKPAQHDHGGSAAMGIPLFWDEAYGGHHFDLYVHDAVDHFDTGFDSGFEVSDGGSGCSSDGGGSGCGSGCGGCGGCGG